MGILQLLAKENYIAYSKPLAKIVGIDEAILFGALCSICNIHGDEFFCQQDRLCEDTCLTEYRLRNAMKNLQNCGLVSVVKKGLPAKNYYCLSEEKFLSIMNLQSTSAVKFDTTGNDKNDSTREDNSDSTYKKQNIKNNKEKNNNNNMYDENFETLWKLLKSTPYDRKSKVSKKRKKELYNMGIERTKKAIDVYLQTQNPNYYHKRDNFLNEIIDNYLDKEVSDFASENQTNTPKEPTKYGGTYL